MNGFQKISQKIAVLETKVHGIEVNVEGNGPCGNDTTFPCNLRSRCGILFLALTLLVQSLKNNCRMSDRQSPAPWYLCCDWLLFASLNPRTKEETAVDRRENKSDMQTYNKDTSEEQICSPFTRLHKLCIQRPEKTPYPQRTRKSMRPNPKVNGHREI